MNEARPLVTVDGVLQDYLDQLLITATMSADDADLVPDPIVAPVKPVEEVRTVVEILPVVAPSVAQISAPVAVAPTSAPLAKVVVLAPVVEEVKPTLQSVATTQEIPALNWQSSQGIECLIFKVAGLKLAIPLPLLGGVYNVTDKVTPLFGQASWSLGIWQGDDEKLTIIDSAELIMPERGMRLRDSGYSFFIQLDRSPWALACQEICDTVTLKHDSIKWRGDASKRPWLAGTVIEEMCALLDVPGVMALLDGQRLSVGKR